MSNFIIDWLASAPPFAIPLLLGCIGSIVNERAGVLNLGVEGMMAVGALCGVIVSFHTASPTLGILASILGGSALALLFGIATVIFRTDQVLSGLIVVGVGAGLTGLFGRSYTQIAVAGFDRLDLGFLSRLPIIGPVLFSQDILVYVGIALVVVVQFFLFHTVIGLRLRAVGEDTAAADVAGIDIQIYRLCAVAAGGGFSGLAGGYLSLAESHIWIEGMVAGRGWIAIALVIFSSWRPGRAVIGALLFGSVEAVIPRIQATGADVPIFLLMMLPYVATLVVLVIRTITSGAKAGAPGNLGFVYLRQDRR
jgi:ABC-type uncharacterized transport system permease subunit